jgi:hypothetical protein
MYVVHGSALPRGNRVNARMQAIDVDDRIGSRILYPAALSAMLRGMKAQNRCGLPGQNDQLISAAVRRQSYNLVGNLGSRMHSKVAVAYRLELSAAAPQSDVCTKQSHQIHL